MRVLVDTTVWSLALRRRAADLSGGQTPERDALADLIADDRAVLIGPIRQELLSGVRDPVSFARLRDRLGSFDDEPLLAADFEGAAEAQNACRRAGVQGSSTDFLICSVAMRREFEVFTSDRDFERYAKVLPILLYRPATPTR